MERKTENNSTYKIHVGKAEEWEQLNGRKPSSAEKQKGLGAFSTDAWRSQEVDKLHTNAMLAVIQLIQGAGRWCQHHESDS